MTIDIKKLDKDTKNKVLYRVMFTWDENNSFYIKEDDGTITDILVSFTPKVNELVKKKLLLLDQTTFSDPNVNGKRIYINLENATNIPLTFFKVNPHTDARKTYFNMLKTYTYTYNGEVEKKTKKNKSNKSNKGGSYKKTLKNYEKNGTTNMRSFQKNITIVFFEMLLLIKLFHWKTHSYATHKATDELYSKFNEHMDKFIEVLLGKTGTRIELTEPKIKLFDLNNQEQLVKKVNSFKEYLVNMEKNKALQTMSNTDLFNIRDEILGDMNQFLYLLSFK